MVYDLLAIKKKGVISFLLLSCLLLIWTAASALGSFQP
ncbi:MAG: hypothetical protein ACI9G1_002633 [Pirellulaceae bacterium]